MLVAVAFIAGLALGFTLGLAAYFGTYTVFVKSFEDREKRRLIQAEQAAFKRGKKVGDTITQARSRYGSMLDAADEEINVEVEKVLGTGPNGGSK